jgi:hypothetical protein
MRIKSCFLALALAGCWVQESTAALIVGFQFAGGGTSQEVTAAGGSYIVNIVASTTTGSTNNLGLQTGYLGALSQVLNASAVDGDITAASMIAGLQTGPTFQLPTLADLNTDSRVDLGNIDGAAKVVGPAVNGWMRFDSGSTPFMLGAAQAVIGTFTVTIPANTPVAGDFLRFSPQVNPGGLGNDWNWTESNSTTPVLGGAITAGTSVTFTAVPEPSTWALASLSGITLLLGYRRRKPS